MPRGARHAMTAADHPRGRDYAWRCIILRSGDIAARNTRAAGRCVRVCAFVTSDGIGGTDGFGGTVPLGDGRGRVVAGLGSGWGAAGSGMVSSLGWHGWPRRGMASVMGTNGRDDRADAHELLR